jgi:hypothetical protein
VSCRARRRATRHLAAGFLFLFFLRVKEDILNSRDYILVVNKSLSQTVRSRINPNNSSRFLFVLQFSFTS